MNKRICQVLHAMQLGGAEVLADRIARGLNSQYKFVFACLDGIGELGVRLIQDGFRVVELGRGKGIDWPCMRRLAHFTRAEKIGLIHAHQYTPFFYSLAARGWSSRPPILFTEHGRFHPDYPRKKRMLFNRLMLRPRDRVVAVGDQVKRALINNEGIPTDRVDVVYNGIPIERFCRTTENRLRLRSEIGVPENGFVMAQVARLDSIKDHGTAVETLRILANRGREAYLLIVGEGPERLRITEAIDRAGLQRQVKMLGSRHDIPEIYSASDLAILTSLSEGIPLCLIEAMAGSLPVVATNVGGIGEVVLDRCTGFLTTPQNAESLADKISMLMDDAELRRQMGTAGFLRASQTFCEQTMHDQYAQLYDSMLPSHPSFSSKLNAIPALIEA